MNRNATTVEEYVESVPEYRRPMVEAIREAVNRSLPEGYEEGMQYGMIGWYVPHSRYPLGYHCDPEEPLPFVQLGNQKSHVGLYLFCTYFDEDKQAWLQEEWKKSGKKLDMGKSCIRIKKLDQVPLNVVEQVVASVPVKEFVSRYDAQFPPEKRKKKRKAKA
jgi:hypothetical protein